MFEAKTLNLSIISVSSCHDSSLKFLNLNSRKHDWFNGVNVAQLLNAQKAQNLNTLVFAEIAEIASARQDSRGDPEYLFEQFRKNLLNN